MKKINIDMLFGFESCFNFNIYYKTIYISKEKVMFTYWTLKNTFACSILYNTFLKCPQNAVNY